LIRAVQIIASVLLFMAPWASGGDYFYALRMVVAVAAILTAIEMKINSYDGPLFWAAIFIAFLFNPLVQVHLYDRGLWAILDFLAGSIFIIFAVRRYKYLDIPKSTSVSTE